MSKNIEREYKISHDTLMNKELSATDLRVYIITRIKVKEANAKGKEFAPDSLSYADALNINVRVLQKSFEKLEHKGYIVREYKNKKRIIHV